MISKLENNFLEIEVDTRGAELTSIKDKSSGTQYLWQGDPAHWENRAPILFPIVGNLNRSRYFYRGFEYSMERHGFAKNMEFHQVYNPDKAPASGNTIAFALTQDGQTLSCYPFKFRLSIEYALQERTITVTYRVLNAGEETMWFSIGGHPAFNCSLRPDGKKHGSLIFEKKETVSRIINEMGYLTGSTEPFLDHQDTVDLSTIDFDSSFKVVILQGILSEKVTLFNEDDGHRVQVKFSGFPTLGIWSPSNRAPFVCIEPWYGITATKGQDDVLDAKRGIQKLEQGREFICRYEIKCERNIPQ